MATMSIEWKFIDCPAAELNLNILAYGQSFRWRKIIDSDVQKYPDGIWRGVMAHRIWELTRLGDRIGYRVLGRFSRSPQSSSTFDDERILRDYFQLDTVDLRRLYEEWSSVDEYISKIAIEMPGIRVLRQEPTECLFSFICSTNNNIKRIGGMVENLCRLFGERIDLELGSTAEIVEIDRNVSTSIGSATASEIDPSESGELERKSPSNTLTKPTKSNRKRRQIVVDEPRESTTTKSISSAVLSSSMAFYDFPTVDRLTAVNVESILRSNGFGYRAAYVAQTARSLIDRFGEADDNIRRGLAAFRDSNHDDNGAAIDFLRRLPGVGPKVADCVALMSMDKTDIVPIDTHVLAITRQHYKRAGTGDRSLTTKMYKEIGDFYRGLFGKYAGWAHSVLFSRRIAK